MSFAGRLGSLAAKGQRGLFGPQTDEAARQAGVPEAMGYYDQGIGAIGSNYDAGINGINANYDQAGNQIGTNYDQAISGYQPWEDFSGTTRNYLSDFLKDPNAIANSESYKFRLNQGTNALQNSALAKGGLLSGNTMRDLTDYSQGLASTEYDNEFNRRMGLANFGAGISGNMAGLRTGKGNALGNLYMNRGNTIGQMYGNKGNALGQMYGNKANALVGGRIGAWEQARGTHNDINNAAAGWVGFGMGKGGG